MMYFIYLAIFAPLLAALLSSFFVTQKPIPLVRLGATTLICMSAFAAFVVFKSVIIDRNTYKIILFDFIHVFNFESKFVIWLDSLSASMLLLVTFVSACVNIYSLNYMQEEPAINRFFTYLAMFTFFMIILITSNDLLQLFVGWEGVGVSSYALISFWFKKNSASSAANKAFIVNRIGDLGLIIGIGLCFFIFQTINLSEISKIFMQYSSHEIYLFGMSFNAINLICFFIFIGCMGKSAQIGLHVWLPDAMEGPTPVSALIHAATMVTAGVFLMARMFYLFDLSEIKYLILIIGGLTSIFAALVACFQTDIKKMIAYSTCSQLGYMFMACAAGGYNAGIFHLLTHGFFKALLFLGAGSIIHATHEQDIRKLPNFLFRSMPYTFILMCIGTLAITGVPPFSGFYSKDAVIEYIGQTNNFNFSNSSENFFHNFASKFAYISALLTVFITAFYSWKLIFKSFFNNKIDSFGKSKDENLHESGFRILFPMSLLAIFAFSSGFILQNSFGILEDSKIFWGKSLISKHLNHHAISFFMKYLPLILSIMGGLVAYYLFMIKNVINKKEDEKDLLIIKVIKNKFYFDEIYQKLIVKNLFCLSALFSYFDKEIFDKFFINGLRDLVYKIGNRMSYFHGGLLYRYNLWQITAIFLTLLYLILKK